MYFILIPCLTKKQRIISKPPKNIIIIINILLFYVYQRYDHLSQNKYWNQIIKKTLELFEEVSLHLGHYFHSFETKHDGFSLNLKLA